MNLKPVTNQVADNQPKFIMSGKNLEWSVGQVTLDASKFQEGEVVKAGTALFRDPSTKLYEKVTGDTPETMEAPVLTGATVVIKGTESNETVSGLKKGSVYSELLTGATDNFKKAVQGRIVFDL